MSSDNHGNLCGFHGRVCSGMYQYSSTRLLTPLESGIAEYYPPCQYTKLSDYPRRLTFNSYPEKSQTTPAPAQETGSSVIPTSWWSRHAPPFLDMCADRSGSRQPSKQRTRMVKSITEWRPGCPTCWGPGPPYTRTPDNGWRGLLSRTPKTTKTSEAQRASKRPILSGL